MIEIFDALTAFAMMVGAFWLGILLQGRLREQHRTRETTDSVRLVITMLLTFAALVLSLLLFSVKTAFDSSTADLRAFAVSLIELDHEFVQYGPQTAPALALVQRYTAGMIASTWPDEAPPKVAPAYVGPPVPGETMESIALGNVLYRVETVILDLQPSTPQQTVLASDLLAHWHDVMEHRWQVIEVAHSTVSAPFMIVMMVWLVLIFGSFGLTMPRHVVNYIVLGLCAFSVALAIFIILDLDTPFSGFINLPSEPMREVLALAGS